MEKLKGRVIGKNILLEPIAIETPSGLILPDAPKQKADTATVLLAGEEAVRVKVGDTVMFQAHSVSPIEIDGVTYLTMSENYVMYIH